VTTSAPRTRRFLTRRKGLAAALVSAGLVVSVAGCSPITTTIPYAASDGIRTTVGDVSVVNFLVVSDEGGTAGRVLGALTNNGEQATTVSLSVPSDGGQPHMVTVEAGETFNLNLEENALVVGDLGETTNKLADGSEETVQVKPGGVVETGIAVTGSDAVTVEVPVVDGTLSEYKDYVPTSTEG
jgi:hypothetical protein